MSDSWDDFAEEWDTNSDAMSYSEKAYEALVQKVNIRGLNIFDFGCGTGLLTEKMASSAKSIIALDVSTLKLLKSLLVPDGLLLQWDWLSPDPASDFGLSETKVKASLGEAGFNQISITTPFSLTSSKGTMPVVMAVAKIS